MWTPLPVHALDCGGTTMAQQTELKHTPAKNTARCIFRQPFGGKQPGRYPATATLEYQMVIDVFSKT